ncbi:hypothetical protein AGMMS49574_03810 [Bacteroidia bacterium]|nr:hypothetical protein AGMMS49574_03810 [Bacteroidia bacterium]
MYKKVILILSVIMSLFACNNEDKNADIQYRFKANIDISEMLSGIKDGNNQDIIYLSSTNMRITVSYLVYDESGKLIHEDKSDKSNIFDNQVFSTMLDGGNYTFVAWAYVQDKEFANEAWSAVNPEYLNMLKIKANTYPWGLNLLGISKMQISLSKSQTIDATLHLAGSFFSVNLFHSPSSKAKYIKMIYTPERNDQYLVAEDKFMTIQTNKDYTSEEYRVYTLSSDFGVMTIPFFYFPTVQPLNLYVQVYDKDANFLKDYLQELNFKKGKNSVITINLDDKTEIVNVTPTN